MDLSCHVRVTQTESALSLGRIFSFSASCSTSPGSLTLWFFLRFLKCTTEIKLTLSVKVELIFKALISECCYYRIMIYFVSMLPPVSQVFPLLHCLKKNINYTVSSGTFIIKVHVPYCTFFRLYSKQGSLDDNTCVDKCIKGGCVGVQVFRQMNMDK